MHLVIFHYHLLPGGVTQVIVSSVVSMLKYIPEITEITLVSGKRDNTENVLNRIQREIEKTPGSEKTLHLEIIPRIGYISDNTASPDSKELTEILTQKFRNGVWWIHNFHLGKNPVFTRTLIEIAEKFRSIRMVLHIHDFPECARFEYIKKLKAHIKGSFYPISENVRYAVINPRDRDYLIKAGIPSTRVFLLDNPVEETQSLPDTFPDRKLDDFFARTEPSYRPGHPLFIYPVRAIRRKNILEAGLITRLLPNSPNLFVTLPGVSAAEKKYSNLVQSAFSRKLIPGVFASGMKGESADITFIRQIAASSFILSTSVQEGFGYLFFNAVQWKKPLYARYLDILRGTETIFKNQRARFYRSIFVPLRRKEKQILHEKYLRKIKTLASVLPASSLLSLEKELSHIFSTESTDFSFLTAEMQLSFLKNLDDTALRHDTAAINREVLHDIDILSSESFTTETAPLSERFSLKNHAGIIQKILYSFENKDTVQGNTTITERLLTIFATIDYLRLLYD